MHRVADRVTVISSVLRERAWHFGRTDAKLIANGVHVDLLHAACERTAKVPGRILFVGRLEPMKGVDTLLRAFAQWKMENGIWKVGPSIHLRIVGDGSERGRLERLAKELNIMERVTFVGFVPVPAVYDEFAAAELFAGLSRSEALGNVFLEAQAAACPVVATNVGGIPDVVVDGQSGILIPPNDPQRAASSMLRILEQDTLRRSMAAAGTEKASQYEWSAIAKQYAAVYEALLRLERTSVVAR
jgi:glycosyltransferase involved in cell wall biosynthesis